MTALQAQYLTLREQGWGHIEAIRILAKRIGVDRNSIVRVISAANARDEPIGRNDGELETN